MQIMKKFSILFLTFIFSFCSFGLVACGNKSQPDETQICEHVWDDGTITTKATKSTQGTITYVCSLCDETKEELYDIKVPTATETYLARQMVVNEDTEGYDFSFSLGSNLSILGLGTSVEGNYTGKYRHNKLNNTETFYRKTSGALFFDSSAYSYTLNDNKVKLECDEYNNPEKVSVMSNSDDSFFANKSIVSLVNSIQTSYINDVRLDNDETPYDFVAEINFSANQPLISKFTWVLSDFGTKIALKNASFTNLTAVPIHFNIDENGRLNDFKMEINLEIHVKLTTINVYLIYEQKGSNSDIQIPTTNNLSIDSAKINSDIQKINQALNDLKNSDSYSIDAIAKNELDPSWNKLAIVDKYTARLYKNKVDENIWFNHSYEYKSHHEDDGAEKYSYTIGNIIDGSTHKVSRKGINETEALADVSADTQFDYLINPFILKDSNIDCISTTSSGSTTVYKIHMNKFAAISIQARVLQIINSNDEPGVVDVNNYMGAQITIKKAIFVITITDGHLENISIETDLKYNPTAGEFTDYNVTLTNALELKINNNLEKAQSYIAPEKAEGNVFETDALDNAKCYIL